MIEQSAESSGMEQAAEAETQSHTRQTEGASLKLSVTVREEASQANYFVDCSYKDE